LRLKQADIRREGCAIECRINAEDPARDFQPSPGTVRAAEWPSGEGVRVDTHIASGSRVSPFYDSLMAKIIVHAVNRPAAIERMSCALARTHIEGVATNLAFHVEVLADPEFRQGGMDTGYLPRFLERRRLAQEVRVHG
jgi:acetyl-CoA carboxylase, biotin carboxylase subunit